MNSPLLNLIKYELPDIDKIYFYAKGSFKSKYQLLISGTKKKKVRIKELKNPKVFSAYPQTIDDVYENLKEYNNTKKRVDSVCWYDRRYKKRKVKN